MIMSSYECCISIQAPHGLPCQLTTFAVENPPPHFARRFGRTNSLHRAILEGNSLLVSVKKPKKWEMQNLQGSDREYGKVLVVSRKNLTRLIGDILMLPS